MAINLKFDLVGNPEPPTIILANRNGNMFGQLKVNEKSIDLSDKFIDASEFSFTLNKYTDEKLTHLWDKVVDFKLVYCKEWDTWFEIKVELDEATETVKTVLCTQLGQAELSQLMLYNIEINTEADIERDDYKISILYDANDKDASILNRLLKDKAPHYHIAYVSPTIARIQRSFSFDGTSILDAFQEIAEEIGCLFQYRAVKDEYGILRREIYVYDLQQYCNDCRHRGEFTDKCPKCNSANITNGYGEDTLIFVTSDELASSGIQLTTDVDSVKNCFKLEAGDDLMTAAIRSCNPNGTDYIWYFSNSIKEDMSNQLVAKLDSYNEIYKEYYTNHVSNVDSDLLYKYNSLIDKYSVYNKDLQKIDNPIIGYSSLMNAHYNTIDLELYLKSALMPSVEMSETNAEEQAKLLTANSISPVAIADVTVASLATINSAVLAMAKIIIRPTYKVQIDSSELIDSGNSRSWRGNFVITNYSDEEDTAISSVISVSINDDLEYFARQKIDKALNKENTDDLSISGLFEKEYEDFCKELKKYALNPLTSFHDACQSCIDILIDQGVGSGDSWSDSEEGSEANLYEKLYLPYYNKLKAIEAEMKIREDEICVISGVYDAEGNLITNGLQTEIEANKSQIHNALNFEDYLGKELWLEFCAYRREDKYSNENYISDGLNNAELFKRALEFFEVAENEIYKSSELQHSISTTLNNLLAIDKFKPLVNSFKVGNWIRVQIDDKIFKLRLLKYDISYSDFNNIDVDFSDVTKVKNGTTDVRDILSQASSMATSYDSVQRQAKQGDNACNTVDQWFSKGLNSANVRILNNDNEEITLSKNGLLGRSYDEITETYSPEQFRLTHNIMAYTTDNWETVSSALGKHEYTKWQNNQWVDDVGYGLSSTFVTAGYVTGSQIIGGEIVSSNYKSRESGTYFDLINGDFEIAGGNIVYDTSDKALTLRNVTIEWSNSNAPEVTVNDITGIDEYLDQLDKLDGRIQTYNQAADPSGAWTSDEYYDHIGDLWINPDNGITKSWNGSAWIVVTDSELKELALSKAQIFTSTPIPPYYVGDLWVQGSSGDIMHCIKSRDTGSYVASDWNKSSKYTDDAKANDAYALADSAKGVADNAKTIGDKLVDGLGFEETEITGKYVISPVIAGGTLLIGDTSGTYAQITTDGKLICTGADISGTIRATDGEFTGTIKSGSIISDSTISGGSININNKFIVDNQGNVIIPSGTLTLGDIDGTSDLATKTYVTEQGYQTESQVTQITKDTITTSYINALNVKAGSVDAENISGTTITGKTISGGYIFGGNLLIGDKSGSYSEITDKGVLNCNGVNIKGNITAISGAVGGWNIFSNGLLGSAYYDDTKKAYYGVALDARKEAFPHKDTNYYASKVFAVGHLGAKTVDNSTIYTANNAIADSWNEAAFYITADGKVVAHQIEVGDGALSYGLGGVVGVLSFATFTKTNFVWTYANGDYKVDIDRNNITVTNVSTGEYRQKSWWELLE